MFDKIKWIRRGSEVSSIENEDAAFKLNVQFPKKYYFIYIYINKHTR